KLYEFDAGRADIQPDHGRMLAPEQCVQKAHDVLPNAPTLCAPDLLISYLNASSKAFVHQRNFPRWNRLLVAKPRRVGNRFDRVFGSTLSPPGVFSRFVANQFTALPREL